MPELTLHQIHEHYGGQFHGDDVVIANFCIDSRVVTKGDIFINLAPKTKDQIAYNQHAEQLGAVAVIVAAYDNNLQISQWVVADTHLALQQVAALIRKQFIDTPIVALTGSCGKTTTKDLLLSILKQSYHAKQIVVTKGNYNNEIGMPLTLTRLNADTKIACIEMGARQTGDIKHLCALAQPNIRLITNIGIAHLAGFGNVETITKTKAEIYADCKVSDNTQLQVCLAVHYQLGNQSLQFEVALNLDARPYLQNAAAAIAIALIVGIAPDSIASGLNQFRATEGRLQTIHCGQNIIVNDSYNSNPTSTNLAIAHLEQIQLPSHHKIIVLGGMLDLGDYSTTLHTEVYSKIQHLTFFLLGEEWQSVPNVDKQQLFFDKDQLLQAIFQTVEHRNCVILVKGSRGYAMETLVQSLTKQFQL